MQKYHFIFEIVASLSILTPKSQRNCLKWQILVCLSLKLDLKTNLLFLPSMQIGCTEIWLYTGVWNGDGHGNWDVEFKDKL